ncbi:MAG: hypothetical protein R3B47_16460 [Bacteroidia bacterium]
MELKPEPGRHVLSIVDEAGQRLSREFVVLGRKE